MMSRLIRVALLALVTLNLIAPTPVAAAPSLQTVTPPNPTISRYLSLLTPEEKIGQLFVITFNGLATDENSAIYELITEYHIGGVVLQTTNDNFADGEAFKPQLANLTSNLQTLATLGTAVQRNRATPTAVRPGPGNEAPPLKQYVPLLITMAYDNDITSSALLMSSSGLTPLPNAMGLGATWNPNHAETIGKIVGQELSALGINMLLGPDLDVIDAPQPAGAADLGARAFGGDPYWVGVLGRAFISGVHNGSKNRLAIISRHFPGYGASDRPLVDDQVPTVNKSLQQLQAVDLQPFFAVTKTGVTSTTDALLVSHIRYRGFQGNIRDTTRPISFDPQALGILMASPELATWRVSGGVMMSDALGVRAVRRLYDVTGRTFPAYPIARDAFLAGNDLLYLSQFGLDPQKDQPETIKAVLKQFVQKYREDTAFAARVDESVGRILALKLKLYGNFAFDIVNPTANLTGIGVNSAATFPVVRDAVTLISPTQLEVTDRLPTPPNANQRLVFFTDTRTTKQCSTCIARPLIATDAFQQAILRLYGLQGTREISTLNLSSYAFSDLANFLDGKKAAPGPLVPTVLTATPAPDLGEVIARADWLIFSLIDVKSTIPNSNMVARILAERPDLVKGKRVLVFAFDAPYYLDTTTVAQLTAYYALYSKTPISLEVAARVLFQEISPAGFSPVSISAINYNLLEVTQPDPKQVIKLFTDVIQTDQGTPSPFPQATATPVPFALNSVVGLRTGVILDRKGHPVPDGTVVKFFATYVNDSLTAQVAEATTSSGVARAALRLDRGGLINVTVTSEPALSSFTLQFNTQRPAPPVVITPTPEPTTTPRITDTPVVVTATPVVRITPTPVPPISRRLESTDILNALLALLVLGGLGWWLMMRERSDPISNGVKLVLIVAIAIWASYDYYALSLPGATLFEVFGSWALTAMIWLGGFLGLWLAWVVLRRR